jgi:hypothetical protein
MSLHFTSSVFKIIVFCDLHYGESNTSDAMSTVFQHKILALEKPDIVIYNGDMSSNYAASGDRWTWWTQQWLAYTAPVREQNITYALNIGNHDVVAKDEIALLQYDMQHGVPVSATIDSAIQSIPIYHDGSVVYQLWLVSSGVSMVTPQSVQDWDGSGSTRGQMFIHIPVPEILDMYDIKGVKAEFTECSIENTGIIAKTRQSKNVDCIWHGHDHVNNYRGMFRDQCIAYGRKSGYGGYASLSPGATVIELIDFGSSWTSYVRLENGEILNPNTLSSNVWSIMQVSCDKTLSWLVFSITCVCILVGLCLLYYMYASGITKSKSRIRYTRI